jgi:hypothetical protein
VHTTLTISKIWFFSRKKWHGIRKLLNKTFFVFGSTCRIFVSAEYSAENVFGRSLVSSSFFTSFTSSLDGVGLTESDIFCCGSSSTHHSTVNNPVYSVHAVHLSIIAGLHRHLLYFGRMANIARSRKRDLIKKALN